MRKIFKNNFNNFLTVLLIFSMLAGWLFSGWPRIWQDPPVPPEIQEAKAAVPAGIVIAWPNASSTIPAGWYRDTALDGYFPKMVPTALTEPGTTGGNETHTHEVTTAHNHIQNAHTHPAGNTAPGDDAVACDKAPAQGLVESNHTHTIAESDSATATNNENTGFTTGAGSSLPPYREILWIYSNGTTDIPQGAIGFWNSATLPTGNWLATTTGLFYRGAPTSSDPSVAAQGSDTHTHTSSHNHTQNAHNHTSPTVTGVSGVGNDEENSGPITFSGTDHTHSITWNEATATNQAADGNIQNQSSWPPYYGLVAAQNDTGSNETPTNIIGLWRGAIGDIPSGWVICDGNNSTPNLLDKFINATSTANFGNTGGSAGHTHTALPHTHIQDPHSHALTIGPASGTAMQSDGTTLTCSTLATHGHPNTTCAEATATNQDATIIVDNNADTRPPYYEVVFIQYQAAEPSLTFSVDSGSQTFPDLTPGTPVATTSILKVKTDNSSGFYITLERDDPNTTLDLNTDDSVNITDKTNWNPTTTVCANDDGNATASTTEPLTLQFRVRSNATDAANYCANWWGSDDTTANAKFAGFPSAAKQIINRSSSAVASTTAYILYNLDAPISQEMGSYSGSITFTAVVNSP